MKWEKMLLGSSIFNLDIPSQPKINASHSMVFWSNHGTKNATGSPNWWLHGCTSHPSNSPIIRRSCIKSRFRPVCWQQKNGLYEVFEFGAIKDARWMHSFKKGSERLVLYIDEYSWNSACWQIMVNSCIDHVSTLHAYIVLPFLVDISCHFHIDILNSSTKPCSACVMTFSLPPWLLVFEACNIWWTFRAVEDTWRALAAGRSGSRRFRPGDGPCKWGLFEDWMEFVDGQMSLQMQIVCKSLNLNMIYAIPEAPLRSNQCNVISFNHLQSGDAKGSVDLTASFWAPQGIWGVSSCDHCSGKLGFLAIGSDSGSDSL